MICFAGKPQKENGAYLFGVAMSFNDSIVHITDVQYVDSAQIDKNGFLVKRAGYAYELKDHFEMKLQMPRRTCTIYFAKNKKKATKLFNKVAERFMQNKNINVNLIDTLQFKFLPPKY
jgi:hypothetical protein